MKTIRYSIIILIFLTCSEVAESQNFQKRVEVGYDNKNNNLYSELSLDKNYNDIECKCKSKTDKKIYFQFQFKIGEKDKVCSRIKVLENGNSSYENCEKEFIKSIEKIKIEPISFPKSINLTSEYKGLYTFVLKCN